jgi:hypothetical protein
MKKRTILLVLVTLIIGFILGMLTSAQIRYHRLKPVRVFFSEERFRDGFYRAIQPDEQQKTKIDDILKKFAKINTNLRDNFRRGTDSSMKALRKELDSNLTKEQLSRLKDMDEKREEMIRKFRRGPENDSMSRRNNPWRNPEGGPVPGGPLPEDDTTRLPNRK